MELSGMQCSGCGSTNVTFDAKNRLLVCNQCGKEEYYSRATLNANGKVVHCRQNATSFFKEGNIEMAAHFAGEVLDVAMDNVPALLILAFRDEFISRRSGSMKQFFAKTRDMALEYDEAEDMMTLFSCVPLKMADYEAEMLKLVALNMQSSQDGQSLCAFVDKVCPLLISRRPSAAFMTEELAEIYHDLAEHCDIPKTCFALLNGIKTNPESPFKMQSFAFETRVNYFYDHYVKPVGEIIGAMRSSDLRGKFLTAYNQCKNQYLQEAKK